MTLSHNFTYVPLARPQLDQSLVAVVGDADNSLSMRRVKLGSTGCISHADGAGHFCYQPTELSHHSKSLSFIYEGVTEMAEQVLVVEDESILLELALEILETEEIRTFGASDAHQALVVLERETEIGLVITDIKMPGKVSGFELAWIIAERWPQISVLVTSGHLMVRADELPPHARFLPKPWLITSFLDKAKEMLLNSEAFRPSKQNRPAGAPTS